MKLILTMLAVSVMINFAAAQNTGTKISGKVFLNYSKTSVLGEGVKRNTKYLSDFKVLLIQFYFATEVAEIEAQKRKICGNDKGLFSKYKVIVAYTDKDGSYEFKGLQRQANYVLIFCDRNIQISKVQTGSKYSIYTIRDKAVIL
jgi:hypothetical protein